MSGECANIMQCLGRALQNYHAAYGRFPPAVTNGPDGTPWHSWRVQILPFLEEDSLFRAYDFGEPWDGPSNSTLCPEAPIFFRCVARSGPASDTSYVAVTGPGTMWPDGRGTSLSEIEDEPADTIMIVEVANSGIHWMEPRDLRIDEMDWLVNGERGNSISSEHAVGAFVVFADGHFERLTRESTAAKLKEWLIISDKHGSAKGSK